ncbi:hypothetical protein OESDEN_00127 [Oesophagostomum dentatum]|uniref:Uncharacterized protein n=1 Tax=Oesophagostomum dentatum TaxID=61180 RepID=A0A0B1TQM3_OESDE|nr:hypothetical protein OESDEN_00127 [Oesophagostomum dentatum]
MVHSTTHLIYTVINTTRIPGFAQTAMNVFIYIEFLATLSENTIYATTKPPNVYTQPTHADSASKMVRTVLSLILRLICDNLSLINTKRGFQRPSMEMDGIGRVL